MSIAFASTSDVIEQAVNAVLNQALQDAEALLLSRLGQVTLAMLSADFHPGLAEHWGRSVLHCPYCHGYEFSGQRLGVLHVSPMSVHQATLIAEWGPTTLYLNGASQPDDESLAQLHTRGVAIEPAPVAAVHGDGAQLSEIELADGRLAKVDALYLGPRTHLNSEIAQQLGCELDEGPNGHIIRTDDQKVTTVPSVYAAGDITRSMHNLTWASADGVMAGLAVHRSLVF